MMLVRGINAVDMEGLACKRLPGYIWHYIFWELFVFLLVAIDTSEGGLQDRWPRQTPSTAKKKGKKKNQKLLISLGDFFLLLPLCKLLLSPFKVQRIHKILFKWVQCVWRVYTVCRISSVRITKAAEYLIPSVEWRSWWSHTICVLFANEIQF